MKQLIKEGKRKCYSCKQVLLLKPECFIRNKGEPNGLDYKCRICTNGSFINSQKDCQKCGKNFISYNPRQKYCGSKLQKIGCSYLIQYKGYLRKKPGRKQRLLKLRFLVFQRYNFTCQYCGRKSPQVELHIDHIIPKSRGGTNSFGNYTVACADCNIGKSDMLLN